MIVVRVELWSARDGSRRELARMRICNDGGTADARRGDYVAETFVGRSAGALDRGAVSRRGRLDRWPRQDRHVWNLVAALLGAMGYGIGARP